MVGLLFSPEDAVHAGPHRYCPRQEIRFIGRGRSPCGRCGHGHSRDRSLRLYAVAPPLSADGVCLSAASPAPRPISCRPDRCRHPERCSSCHPESYHAGGKQGNGHGVGIPMMAIAPLSLGWPHHVRMNWRGTSPLQRVSVAAQGVQLAAPARDVACATI
jgi:hypothetical protein